MAYTDPTVKQSTQRYLQCRQERNKTPASECIVVKAPSSSNWLESFIGSRAVLAAHLRTEVFPIGVGLFPTLVLHLANTYAHTEIYYSMSSKDADCLGQYWPWTDANGDLVVDEIVIIEREYPRYERGYDEFADPLPRDD